MKRCLKFTGYIYLPKDFNKKSLKYHLIYPRVGRLEIFDENNNRTGLKMQPFGNICEAGTLIERAFRKRIKLLKTQTGGLNNHEN